MSSIRKQKINGKMYYSLVRRIKVKGKWRYKTLESYGTQKPIAHKPTIIKEIADNLAVVRKHLKRHKVAVQELNSKRKDGEDKRPQNYPVLKGRLLNQNRAKDERFRNTITGELL